MGNTSKLARSRIWEVVAANAIEVGDILAWNVNPTSDGAPDFSARVKVTRVDARECPEPLPYVVLDVAGPTVPFERMSGARTGRTCRQGDPVVRMRRDHAAKVGENFRTVIIGVSSAQRLANAAASIDLSGDL